MAILGQIEPRIGDDEISGAARLLAPELKSRLEENMGLFRSFGRAIGTDRIRPFAEIGYREGEHRRASVVGRGREVDQQRMLACNDLAYPYAADLPEAPQRQFIRAASLAARVCQKASPRDDAAALSDRLITSSVQPMPEEQHERD